MSASWAVFFGQQLHVGHANLQLEASSIQGACCVALIGIKLTKPSTNASAHTANHLHWQKFDPMFLRRAVVNRDSVRNCTIPKECSLLPAPGADVYDNARPV